MPLPQLAQEKVNSAISRLVVVRFPLFVARPHVRVGIE